MIETLRRPSRQRDLADYLKWWTDRNSRPGFYGTATVEGMTVRVRKGVFSPDPKVTFSTTSLIQALPDLKGKTVLEIGAGSGIVAIYAGRQGASRITAVDLQPEAVLNARENIEVFGLTESIEVLESDVFESVCGRYDVFAANLPFMVLKYVLNHIATETYRRFFAGLSEHLNPGGRAYLTFASFGDVETLEQMIADSPFLSTNHTQEHNGLTWYVFELRKP